MRIAFLALAWLMACTLSARMATAAPREFPYGPSVEFAAFRNGQKIGLHRVDFQRAGDRLVATTSINLAVKVLGLTAYRYSHRGQEIWAGNRQANVVPCPSWLSTQTEPPCRCRMCLTIESPSPVPPCSRERALSTR